MVFSTYSYSTTTALTGVLDAGLDGDGDDVLTRAPAQPGAAFRIHDILVWIRMRIRILLFSSLTFKMPTKNKFKQKVFLHSTF